MKRQGAAQRERERCIDELLYHAGEALDDVRREEYLRFRLIDAVSYYRAARILMLGLDYSVAVSWPSAIDWEQWAREACGL